MIIETLITSGLSYLAKLAVNKGTETVKELIKEKTGIDLKPDMNPEEISKLKELEMQLQTEKEKAYLDDRKDARGMQKIALQQDDKFSKRFIYYYATSVTLFTFLYIFLITFIAIPQENIRFADTVLGFLLGTLISTIVYYFFGTSKSSNEKTGILNEILKRM